MAINPGMALGQYQILEELGRGGMAVVYKGHQPSLDRHVAIKVLPAFYADDASFVERFRTEAIAIAQLRHPNILTVFDFDQQEGVYYLVMEYVSGGTLQDRLGQPLPLEGALGLIRPVASALDYAHSRNVLHRDVKPSNVLLTSEGVPVLADFGLAKMMEGTARLTRTGLTVGTPEYMSPEQAMGRAVGKEGDHYSLAIILYEMLTGRVPFVADTPVGVVLAHLNDPPPPPRASNPQLSEAVEAALLKGLAKRPEDRYQNGVEMVDAVQAAAAGQALPPTLPVTAGQQPVRRRSTSQLRAVAPAQPSTSPELSELEFRDVWVDLTAYRLAFASAGFQRAAQLLAKQLASLQAEGWELIEDLDHPSLYSQGRSLRGPIIRGATLPLRRRRAE